MIYFDAILYFLTSHFSHIFSISVSHFPTNITIVERQKNISVHPVTDTFYLVKKKQVSRMTAFNRIYFYNYFFINDYLLNLPIINRYHFLLKQRTHKKDVLPCIMICSSFLWVLAMYRLDLESLWDSSATMLLVDFHHRLTSD